VAAVLQEHWIEGGRRQRRLSTVSRGSDRAPARCGAQEREKIEMQVHEAKSEFVGSSRTCFK
jgi:hypothetical protein